jgi:hypothetical protein
MKTFSTRMCWICGRMISANGFGWISHCRAHVREGLLKEILDYDGRITFRKLPKQKSKRGEQRMKAEMIVKKEVVLKLEEHEAQWLKCAMQNPLWNETPDKEDKQNREMRTLFFNTLKEQLGD